jgi:UDP-N-acetylglucosamine acyltransferase
MGPWIGGVTGVHQFVRIGAYSMVGREFTAVARCAPLSPGQRGPATVHGLNTVGLRRAGFSPEMRRELKIAYCTLSFQLEREPGP